MYHLTLTKTDAGRAEIRARALPLSRAARNLLLIIDGAHDSAHWLRLVKGSAEADLQALLASGLVSAVEGGRPRQTVAPMAAADTRPAGLASASARTAVAPAAAMRLPASVEHGASDGPPSAPPDAGTLSGAALVDALQRTSFRELYDRLTAEARPRLGLIAGYRAILAVERATDVAALRDVALQFIAQVRESNGEQASLEVAQRLVSGR